MGGIGHRCGMFTTKVLARLAAVVFALWATSAAVGDGNDLPLLLDDILWGATLMSTVALLALCLAVFAKRAGGGT